MNKLIRAVFDRLCESGINYCVLRGYEELRQKAARLEVDLLVDPAQLSRLSQILAELDFSPLLSSGHAPHFFFVAYDRSAGTWIKLDVVTDLVYGRPVSYLKLNLTRECLSRRQLRGVAYTLSPADEFLTLLLHSALDKKKIEPKHQNRLKELSLHIRKHEEMLDSLDESLHGLLGLTISTTELQNMIESEDWRSLAALRGQLNRKLFALSPASSWARFILNAVLRKFRPLTFVLKRHGVSVALLAPDGAGKSTLASKLSQDFYLKARLIYMGTNHKASTVRLPLSGWFAERIKDARETSQRETLYGILLRGGNLCHKFAEHWYRCLTAYYHLIRGRFVVFDRFIYDSWVNRPPSGNRVRRFLYEGLCPRPGLVILLDAPGQRLFERKGEHSPEWLEQQRTGYLKLRDNIPQMHIVDALQNAEQVKSEVTALIWKSYGLKGMNKEFNGSRG